MVNTDGNPNSTLGETTVAISKVLRPKVRVASMILLPVAIASTIGACWGLAIATFVHTNPLDFWPAIIAYSVFAGIIGLVVGASWVATKFLHE